MAGLGDVLVGVAEYQWYQRETPKEPLCLSYIQKLVALQVYVCTITSMTIDFDPPKSLKNARERGLSFEVVERFDWETCLLGLSPRQEMTATRFLAVGFLDGDLVVVVFTIHAA